MSDFYFLHCSVVQGGGDSVALTVAAWSRTVSTSKTFQNIPQHSLQSASFYFGGVEYSTNTLSILTK